MSEIGMPPRLEPEAIRLAARPPSPTVALAAQQQLQAFVETMPDGTRVLYRMDGTPIRQWNVDGSIVSFDGHGRPVPGTTAHGPDHPSPGPPATAHRTPLLVDQPAGQARPVGVTFPDGTRARYEYQADGGRVVHYSTGVVTTEDGAGHILAERLPDGTTFTAFDRNGRPTAATGPVQTRQPGDAPPIPQGVRAVDQPRQPGDAPPIPRGVRAVDEIRQTGRRAADPAAGARGRRPDRAGGASGHRRRDGD